MSFLSFLNAIPDFIEDNYAKIPKPIRFVLHPFWVIIFIIVAIPLASILAIADGYRILKKSYEDFDNDWN